MDQLYLDYLKVLDELRESMDQLAALARQKTDAVRTDDLMALDEVLKQEQAMSLSLRGIEQRREKLLSQLGLERVSLSALPMRYPDGLQLQAREKAEALRRSYGTYRAAAEIARNTLEINLHQIDQIVQSMGGAGPVGAGYQRVSEPPKNMKTDFRA